jgi:MFS family permease
VFARTGANERRLIGASFLANVGIEAAYFVGFLGYLAYGFNAGPALMATVMFVLNFSHVLGDASSGVFIDRMGPRRTTFLFNATLVVLCVAGQWCGTNIYAYSVFAGLVGYCMSIIKTALGSFAPYLERDRTGLKRINTLVTIGGFTATIVGPFAAGLITRYFPTMRLFVFTAGAVAAAALITLAVRERYRPDRGGDASDGGRTERRHPVREAVEGARFVFQHQSLRYYLVVGVMMWFAFGAFDALESLYYRDVLQVGISWMGWMNTITGVGLVLGSVVLARANTRWVNARSLVAMLLLEGLGTVLYVGTHSVWWAACGSFVLGVAFGINEPMMRTLIQVDSPLEKAGRTLGTIQTFRIALTLLPLVVAPTLAKWTSPQAVLVAAGFLTVLFAVVLVRSSYRIDRRKAAGRKISQVDPFADPDDINPRERASSTEDAHLLFEE